MLTLADEKTARSMPTHFLLTTEVRRPEDLEYADFLLGPQPKAAQALDLLLGTQGWRRFAEQDPGQFREQHHDKDEAERLLVTIGQSAPRSDRPRRRRRSGEIDDETDARASTPAASRSYDAAERRRRNAAAATTATTTAVGDAGGATERLRASRSALSGLPLLAALLRAGRRWSAWSCGLARSAAAGAAVLRRRRLPCAGAAACCRLAMLVATQRRARPARTPADATAATAAAPPGPRCRPDDAARRSAG